MALFLLCRRTVGQGGTKVRQNSFLVIFFFSCPVERQYIEGYLSKISDSGLHDMGVNLLLQTAKSSIFAFIVRKLLIS